jgi:uncharacterized protein YjlB
MTRSNEVTLTTLENLQVSQHHIPAFDNFPNSSLHGKPLLIYHSAFYKPNASQIESHLSSIGVVTPSWRYTMYSTSHFHSNTHEVLGISAGSAKLCFGGEGNPDRVEPVVNQGDVIVVPAGVAHRLLEDRSDFCMVGSYPADQSWDMCYGRDNEAHTVQDIKHLAWFDRDPVYGNQGPVLDV